MAQQINCIRVGVYGYALTRGKQYELLANDEARSQVRVRGDNNRTRWYSSWYFDFEGVTVISLTSWEFDYPVIDERSHRDATSNYVEVTMDFDDGTQRWCGFMTPDYLKNLLEPRSDPSQWGRAYEPALYSKHIIFIRDLNYETVDWMLRYMDAQGELFSHTLLIGYAELPDDKNEEE